MPLDRFSFTYVCFENCMSGFSAFDLNSSKSGNILFRSMANGNFLFSSASFSLVGKNSLVHELRVMAAVELHVNSTYAQHPALKSVYEKSQPRIGGKLFSSYRTVFELAQQCPQDSKTSDLNCSYEALVHKEALTLCQDKHNFYLLYHYHQFKEGS